MSVTETIGQNQSAFGVGVVHLDGFPIHCGHNIARLVGTTTGQILAERCQACKEGLGQFECDQMGGILLTDHVDRCLL